MYVFLYHLFLTLNLFMLTGLGLHNMGHNMKIPGCSKDFNVLTSSRPPFDGADRGTVQNKLLSGWVVCGRGLQPSEVCT